jgi:hypothetical protein
MSGGEEGGKYVKQKYAEMNLGEIYRTRGKKLTSKASRRHNKGEF